MWVVTLALPSSFSENETKGLLIKPRARRLKCHMGLQEAWVGRGGAQGRLRLLPPPATSRGEKEVLAQDAQGRFWSSARALGPVTSPAFRGCTRATTRAAAAHPAPFRYAGC